MYKLKIVFLFAFIYVAGAINANTIAKAFSALQSFNYFEAKRLFEKSIEQETAAAGYGLSVIYFCDDNPFINLYLKFNVSLNAIDSLKEKIYHKAYEIYKSHKSIVELDKFIDHYYTAPQLHEATDLRNSLAFREAQKADTYQAYQLFWETYPLADEIHEAQELFTFRFFQASTKNNTIEEFEQYLAKEPNSPYINEVENSIYALSTPNGKVDEYYHFIKKYPKNHNVGAAWHNIYSIYSADYKTASLVEFKIDFPNSPFSEIVLKDIELSQKHLFAIRENNKWGFADSTGTIIIPCTYEWVENFS